MRDLSKIRTKYEVRLDNRQIAFLLAGSLVALVVVFSLGVLVGKGLGQLPAETQPTPVAAEPTPAPGVEPLSLASAFGEPTADEIPEGVQLDPTPEVIEPAEATPDHTPLPSEADTAPALEETPAAVDFGALPGPPSGNDYWTVQIGSYPTQAEAQELYQRMVGKGNRCFVEQTDLGERGTWYRVSVGQYATDAGAKAMAAAMREREHLDTWVRYVQ